MGRNVLLSLIGILTFVSISMADTYISSDGTGTYIGGLTHHNPNGAYVRAAPSVTKDGYYVDGTPKKKYRQKKWQQLKTSQSFKLLSSLKTHSK